MPHQTCFECHFLVKEWRGERYPSPVFSLTHEERALCQKGDFTWTARPPQVLCCHQGVWDVGQQGFERAKLRETITLVERKDFCFFAPYRPGMLLPAAKELQLRASDRSEYARDRRLTIVGLWIAALALLAQVVLTIIDRFK